MDDVGVHHVWCESANCCDIGLLEDFSTLPGFVPARAEIDCPEPIPVCGAELGADGTLEVSKDFLNRVEHGAPRR